MEIVVIGAGVVGLAVAARLAQRHTVTILEGHPHFGQETSSRNSEVIHSGIYYPDRSEKTRLCIEGRDLLYAYCEANHVPFKQIGKWLVSTSDQDAAYLDRLQSHCRAISVPLERKTAPAVREKEPHVVSAGDCLFFPLTGILDSHDFMKALEREALAKGATFVYRHRVLNVEKTSQWEVSGSGPGEGFTMSADAVVNCAGLAGAEISNQALHSERFEHRYCRGRYFQLAPRFRNAFHSLIYPVPQPDGLGIHVTVDLEGSARLGPNAEWVVGTYADHARLYEGDWVNRDLEFYQAAQRYCPRLDRSDLTPAFTGIRPKLFVDGRAHPDFCIENKAGFVHCLGIESPGLTASLAIAKEVERILE